MCEEEMLLIKLDIVKPFPVNYGIFQGTFVDDKLILWLLFVPIVLKR
jgi:hypothetical protein